MNGKLFIICASSGAGKTSLASSLVKNLNNAHAAELIIGHTSRPARPGEIEGRDYHYLSPNLFRQDIDKGRFLEWSFGYGHYYGTSIDVLDKLAAGMHCVVVAGIRGVPAILERVPEATAIWITLSDIELLADRLKKRGQQGLDLDARMAIARQEFEVIKNQEIFNHIVLNDDFDQASFDIFSIACQVLSIEHKA